MRRYTLAAFLMGLTLAAACGGDKPKPTAANEDGGGGSSGKAGGGSGKGGHGGSGGPDGGGADGSVAGADAGGGKPINDAGADAALADAGVDAAIVLWDSNVPACTKVVPSPNEITAVQRSSTFPTPEGGTVQDGVYYLSAFDVYAPAVADNKVLRRLLKVTGNNLVGIQQDGTDPEADNVGTFTTSGSSLTFSVTCPFVGSPVLIYSATATEITLFRDDLGTVAIYTKQ